MAGTSSGDDGMALLVGAPPPVASKDRHVRALLANTYHHFHQWKAPANENARAALTRLRDTLDRLLPVLTGARDFAGAAKVLSIMYHRFTVAPALCVQTSLEILRRQPEHRDDVLQFYLAAIQENRLDKRLLLKELWMFYIVQGEFYEAYHLYKDDIQRLDVHEDPRLLANFGILCYWLLFIESSELRDKLKRDEDLEGDDDDDDDEEGGIDLDLRDEDEDDEVREENSELEDVDEDDELIISSSSRSKKRKRSSRINQWPSFSQSSTAKQSVESIIESRYLFKTSIGVHILYQEATSALRRAASLCPTSAQFAEFYVQLLVLVGEIDTACDYLENFYHLNDSDPHGAKMLAGFLEMYYPDSIDTQITVYLRWLKNDPMSSYALEKIVELVSAGSIPTMDLIQALIEALDMCGGDLYLSQAPSASLALWKLLAEFLVAIRYEMSDRKDALRQKLISIGAARVWWKRAYFARPRLKDEVLAIVQGSKDTVIVEAMIYRAAVAMNLFGYGFPMARVVHTTLNFPDESIKPEHVRVFKSCFTNVDHLRFKFMPPLEAPRVFFRDVPFRHIVHQQEPNAGLLTEFKGDQLVGTHVMKRSDLIMNANAAQERRIKVVTESLTHEVDEELVAALEEAVRDDSLAQEIEEEHYKAMAQRATRTLPASIVTLVTVPEGPRKPRKHEMALPLYVNLVEETAFKDRHAPINHIYTFVVESLKQTSLKDVIVPTLMEVENAHRLFLVRWMRNEFKYGHPGLLLRYETFLAKFVQPHVHAALRTGEHFAVTSAMVDDAMQQMRVQIAASHVHFPEHHKVETMLRVKAGVMLRLRRKVLRYFRHSMKVVMVKLVFLEERELASLAYEVCKLNGLEGVVSLEDLECIAVPALFRIYRKLLFKMQVPHRMFVRDVIYQAREQQQPVDVPFLTTQLKEKFPKYSPSVRTLKACLWVTKYEATYGPLESFWNWMERMPKAEWHDMKLRERELLREYNQQQAEAASAAAAQGLEDNELRI